MQSHNTWSFVISFFCSVCFQKRGIWLMPAWCPLWKRLLGTFKSVFLYRLYFSRMCTRSRMGEGVTGMHWAKAFRSVCHVFCFHQLLPIPTDTVLLESLGTATPVCYLFRIVVLLCISLMTRWAMTMFLFLTVCFSWRNVILRPWPTSKSLFYCLSYVSLCEFIYTCAWGSPQRSEERPQIYSLELELQVVWGAVAVLGCELGSSARAVWILSCRAISPAIFVF